MTERQTRRLPLSAAQRGVWFAHRLDPTGQQMNCAEYLAIDGPVDPDLMRAAWRQVAVEADATRTSAIVEDDGLWQLVPEGPPPELGCHDLSASADPATEAQRWMTADVMRPVDVSAGGLSTFALLKLASDRYYFYYRMHHASTDGYGVLLLARRLAEVYTALADGRTDSGEPLGSFATLVEQDHAYRASAAFPRDRAYWTDRLGDQPDVMRMPGAQVVGEPDARPLRLSRPDRLGDTDVEALARVARQTRTTWQVVLLAAIAAYVHRVTGRRDVILGLPVAGRRTALTRRVVGMATNSVALRVDVDPGGAWPTWWPRWPARSAPPCGTSGTAPRTCAGRWAAPAAPTRSSAPWSTSCRTRRSCSSAAPARPRTTWRPGRSSTTRSPSPAPPVVRCR